MSELKCGRFCLRNQLINTAEQARANSAQARGRASLEAIGSTQRTSFERSASSLDLAANKTQTVADGIITQDEGGPCHGRGMCGSVAKL